MCAALSVLPLRHWCHIDTGEPISAQAQAEGITAELRQSWSWYLFGSGPLGLLTIRK